MLRVADGSTQGTTAVYIQIRSYQGELFLRNVLHLNIFIPITLSRAPNFSVITNKMRSAYLSHLHLPARTLSSSDKQLVSVPLIALTFQFIGESHQR